MLILLKKLLFLAYQTSAPADKDAFPLSSYLIGALPAGKCVPSLPHAAFSCVLTQNIYSVFSIRYSELKFKTFAKYNMKNNQRTGDDMKDVLEEITRLRILRGWSDLAQNAGVTQSTISTWYRRKQTPTIQTLEKVCNGFGITLSQFFAEGDDAISLTLVQREMLDRWSALNSKAAGNCFGSTQEYVTPI